MRISIRYKILIVVSSLLVGAVIIQALIAAREFERDKTELIFDLNKSIVKTFGAELQTTLSGSIDKLKLFVTFYDFHRNQTDSSRAKQFSQLLESDKHLVYAGVFPLLPGPTIDKPLLEASQNSFLEIHELNAQFWSNLALQRPLPLSKIISSGYHIWNATTPQRPALIGIGLFVPFETAPSEGVLSIGYLNAEEFLEKIREQRMTEISVVDIMGSALLSSNIHDVATMMDFSTLAPYQEAQKSVFSSAVLKFKHLGQLRMGAYGKIAIANLTVISHSSARLAFVAVEEVLSQTRIFSLIVATFTFIVIMIFSRSLTKPLEKLRHAMRELRNGNLVELIPTGDEIGALSRNFTEMAKDIKLSRSKLEEANRELENRVGERTKELQAKTKELEILATKDPLTNLYNRRVLNETLEKSIENSKREGSPLSVIYLDIDFFKKYNDHGGHPAGDALLVGFSSIISSHLPPESTFARMGGEEFCIVLPRTPASATVQIAESIRKLIESHPFRFGEAQPGGRVTASLGVSELLPGMNAEGLIKAADNALYVAKNSGRNQVQLAKAA